MQKVATPQLAHAIMMTEKDTQGKTLTGIAYGKREIFLGENHSFNQRKIHAQCQAKRGQLSRG